MKATTAKVTTKAKVSSSSGFRVDLLQAGTLNEYLGKLKLPADGSLLERARRLDKFMVERLATMKTNGLDTASTCECGGHSDCRFQKCPFCGDAATDGEFVASAETEALALSSLLGAEQKLVQVPRKRRGADEKSNGHGHAAGPFEEAVQKVAASAVSPLAESVPPQVEAAAELLAPEGEAGVPATLVEAAEVAPGTPLEELDTRVAHVHAAIGTSYELMWDSGREIVEVYERRLWALRKDDGGRQVYPTFREWVRRELPMTAEYAYQLMHVSTTFERHDFRLIGMKKLLLVLRAPSELRAPLLEQAREAKSYAQLRQSITEMTGSGAPALPPPEPSETPAPPPPKAPTIGKFAAPAPVPAPARGQSKVPAAKGPSAPPPITNAMVVLSLGRTRLKCMARAEKKGVERRAKGLADDPWVSETLDGRVVVRYSIQVDSKGQIELVVDRKLAPAS